MRLRFGLDARSSACSGGWRPLQSSTRNPATLHVCVACLVSLWMGRDLARARRDLDRPDLPRPTS